MGDEHSSGGPVDFEAPGQEACLGGREVAVKGQAIVALENLDLDQLSAT
jgi:hypothetical protein